MLEQDFLDNIINVQWPASNWMTYGFRIRTLTTFANQQPVFFFGALDGTNEDGTGLPFFPTPPGPPANSWFTYVTAFQYVWDSWHWQGNNYSDPAFGGSGWQVLRVNNDAPPASFARSYNMNNGAWTGVFIEEKDKFVGLQTLPGGDRSVPPRTINHGSPGFWPQCEWHHTASGGTITPEESTIGPVMAPRGEGEPALPFTTDLSAIIRLRGGTMTDTGKQDSGARVFTIDEASVVGVTPSGGPTFGAAGVADDDPQATAAEVTIDFSSFKIVTPQRTWEAVGAAHRPTHLTPIQEANAVSRPCGVLWILLKPVVTP